MHTCLHINENQRFFTARQSADHHSALQLWITTIAKTYFYGHFVP
ncbi:hypothetical protein BN2497_14345 [Janthinobacterium sp. CG23_2]|nr:hypothetical protein BN2497_14345 [Janthinobacterium sp. CG23_2]CUU33570.1 hypothetical protein BN3177_14345 [Janthinobacterium sp. CG23_2]